MAKTQIADNIIPGPGCKATETVIYCKMKQLFLKDNFALSYETKQSYYQVIMLLCIYITDLKIYVHTKIHIHIFIVVSYS